MVETWSRGWLSRTCALSLALLASWGCGGAEQTPETPATPGAAPEGGGTGDQAALGGKLYGEHCAKCHGANGEGGDAPPVVGKSALPLAPPPTAKGRKSQFKTAADVADFVTKNMPPDAAGSLKPAEYWAILAFDLKANGVDLGGKQLGPENAASFVLHP